MGATVIPGAGTVFRAMANKGAWGSFDAQGGALVSADEQTISLPAPVVVDATTLKGDGWTATSARGGPCSRAHGRARSGSCGNDRSTAAAGRLVWRRLTHERSISMGTRLRSSVALLALVACACSASAPGIGCPGTRASALGDDGCGVRANKDGLALTFDVHRPAQPNGAGVIAS